MPRFYLLAAILIWSLIPIIAQAHPGGLDSSGCHQDRNHGDYHCHNAALAGKSFASKAEMLAKRQENSYTSIPPIVPVQQFSGKVVGVLDGDTIDVIHNGKAERVRLNGIDSPERDQPFGRTAKKQSSHLAFNREVTVRPVGIDRYGRTVGEVTLPDGHSLNQDLVKLGFAWWYRRYAPQDTRLAKLEEEARKAGRGLWADVNPIPPWEWRHRRR